jgi:hypothetical protein
VNFHRNDATLFLDLRGASASLGGGTFFVVEVACFLDELGRL